MKCAVFIIKCHDEIDHFMQIIYLNKKKKEDRTSSSHQGYQRQETKSPSVILVADFWPLKL